MFGEFFHCCFLFILSCALHPGISDSYSRQSLTAVRATPNKYLDVT